ncbi:hypothetical protein LCL86_11410 [Muricauda ruestringensis]|uniref:hypothetical protein n=1 Tax=Flagellimonas ruestringensis TaxID=111501 RepID=UPI001CD4AF63|nr:hypothetical protein [Allomuricauda ruestringensis]MCA0959655.1 hypothetical protein [Allomuricauda ruestringensis]
MKNIEILSDKELLEIDGGGFFKDLGAAAHKLWNEFCEYSSNKYVEHPGTSFQ